MHAMMNKHLRNNKWIITGFLLLLAVSAIFIYRGAVSKPAIAGRDRVIAVLPFASLSGDSSNEYLCEGMTDELIDRLSKITGLRVIARSSVMRFKGKKINLKHVADSLGVSAILTGGIGKSGNQVFGR